MGTKSKGKARSAHRGEPARAHAAPVRAGSPADRVVLALASFGLLLTAYLTFVAGSGEAAAFCSAGSGCDVVQGSAWSRLFGIPIALWGFGLYALLALDAWRPATRLQRWRRLWRWSLIGLAISVYLTAAGIVALQAACVWCLLSLATMAAIFLRVALHRPDGAPGTAWSSWLLGNGLVALALVGVLHVASVGLWERPADARLAALADHLQASGTKYYGASWCANCRNQSRMFGRAAERLPYVECAPDGRAGGIAFACTSAGITGFPTWIIGGQPHTGVLEPRQLADMTGFDWEAAAP